MQSTFSPPLHEDFDEAFRDLFVNGNQKGVCAYLPRDKGQLSKELNPEEPAESDAYNFARFLWACYSANHDLGARVWAFMENFNAQFQRRPEAVQPLGLMHKLTGLLAEMTDPGAAASEQTRLANEAIELFEGFKVGLGAEAGEGPSAVRQMRGK